MLRYSIFSKPNNSLRAPDVVLDNDLDNLHNNKGNRITDVDKDRNGKYFAEIAEKYFRVNDF